MFVKQRLQHHGVSGEGEGGVDVAGGLDPPFKPAALRVVKMGSDRHQRIGILGFPQRPQDKDRLGGHLRQPGVVLPVVPERIPGVAIPPDGVFHVPGRLGKRKIGPGG